MLVLADLEGCSYQSVFGADYNMKGGYGSLIFVVLEHARERASSSWSVFESGRIGRALETFVCADLWECSS